MGLAPNLGIDLYPELMDVFQIQPLEVNRTLITTSVYGPREVSDEIEELQRLNLEINSHVNDEDRELCLNVQRGLGTAGYSPGPLAAQESSIHHFHCLIRDAIPVASLREEPRSESVIAANERMLAG